MMDSIMDNRAYLKIFDSDSLKWDNLTAENAEDSLYAQGAQLLGKAKEQLFGGGFAGSREESFWPGGKISEGMFQVRYNPKTIHFHAVTQNAMVPGSNAKREQQIGMIPAGNVVSMDVELIFDSDSMSDTSVRDEMNLLLALMQKSRTREAGFYWGKMKIEGRITDFHGEYHSFHPNGMPAVGTIGISIQVISGQSGIARKIDAMTKDKPDKLAE